MEKVRRERERNGIRIRLEMKVGCFIGWKNDE
jgi:hypothetical protein